MPRLLSSTEVSRLLGVSSASVKRWADSGRLHCVLTPGRHRRFHRAEVERFQEAQTQLTSEVSGWADRLLSAHGSAGIQGSLLEERSRGGTWWRVAEQLGLVGPELARRVAAGRISAVEASIAGERLHRVVQQCTSTMPRTGAPCLLLVRPEFDHARLGLALVELCAGDLGMETRLVGSVEVGEVRRHLEQSAPSAVVLAASPETGDPHRVVAYASALQAACERLELPFAFIRDSQWASAGDLVGDAGMAEFWSWLQAVQPAQAVVPPRPPPKR